MVCITCCWVSTSSAVVGSSKTISLGRSDSTIARQTR